MIKECERTVTFGMPEWWPPSRLNFQPDPGTYGKDHIWAGQTIYDNIRTENSAENAVLNLSGAKETCTCPWSSWVMFEVPISIRDKEKWINNTRLKLERLLQRYKESKIKKIRCKFCHEFCDAKTAHAHVNGWVGDECCWDERLRITE